MIAVDASQKAMDPLEFFPLELFEMLLSYLEFREIVYGPNRSTELVTC